MPTKLTTTVSTNYIFCENFSIAYSFPELNMNYSDFDYYKGKRRTGRIGWWLEYFHDNAECVTDEKTKASSKNSH